MSGRKIVSLSLLVERLASDGPRDELFVRSLGAWLGEHAAHLRLPLVERLELRDVVITFKMKQHVRLIITGYPPDPLPGEVTVAIDERDFPFVELAVTDRAHPDPYEICTLDYSLAGRRVHVVTGQHAGRAGDLLVAATVGGRQENRVRLDSGQVVTLGGDHLELAD